MKPHKRFHPSLEQLETRLAPVVGAFDFANLVPRGAGYDGVAMLEIAFPDGSNGFCTGSLLTTSRHLLTAAHCLADDAGQIVSPYTDAIFQLLDGSTPRNITLRVPSSSFRVHPGFTGDTMEGHDIGLLVLPDQDDPASGRQMVAPFGAERYSLFTGSDEIGQVFTVVGYGRTGTGNTGSRPGSGGDKRIGSNLFEAYASKLAEPPFSSDPTPPGQTALAWDFDNGTPTHDAFGFFYGMSNLGLGASEANPAQGDSGGPLFIGSQIAGVVSYSDGGVSPPDINTEIDRSFGEFGVGTRVSAFQDFITQNTAGAYDLVLDLRYQLVGVNELIENLTIIARRVGDNLELAVENAVNPALDGVYYSAPVADIRSLKLVGSDDNETFVIQGNIGINSIDVQAGPGNDVLRFESPSGPSWQYHIRFDGCDGQNRFDFVTAQSVFATLSPTSFTRGLDENPPTIELANVQTANITGSPQGDTFILNGWWKTAHFDGGGSAGGLDFLYVGAPVAFISSAPDSPSGSVRMAFPQRPQGIAYYQNFDFASNLQNTDQTYIQSLFLNLRGETLSSSQLGQIYNSYLQHNRSRSWVAELVQHSRPAREYLTRSWFVKYLGRQPGPGETTPYVNRLMAGQSQERVLASLLGSPLFATTTAQFQQRLFKALLGRPATPTDVATWGWTTMTRTQAALRVLTGGEFRLRFLWQLQQSATPGRSLRPAVLSEWVASRWTMDRLQVQFFVNDFFYWIPL